MKILFAIGAAAILAGYLLSVTGYTHYLCEYPGKTELHKIGPSTTPHLEGNDNCKKVRL